MFFEPHLKLIYSPPNSDKQYDPLALDRAMTYHSGGKINDILKAWNASSDGLGDVGPGAREAKEVMTAQAEASLVEIARKMFGLPDFPECFDATALECLSDYLEWMEGKGRRAASP